MYALIASMISTPILVNFSMYLFFKLLTQKDILANVDYFSCGAYG